MKFLLIKGKKIKDYLFALLLTIFLREKYLLRQREHYYCILYSLKKKQISDLIILHMKEFRRTTNYNIMRLKIY